MEASVFSDQACQVCSENRGKVLTTPATPKGSWRRTKKLLGNQTTPFIEHVKKKPKENGYKLASS